MKCTLYTRLLILSTLLLPAGAAGFGQGVNQGAQIFVQSCSSCHGADGTGTGRGTAIATQPSVIAMSNADLVKIIRKGTPAGMPAFPQLTDQQAQAVVQFLRRLQGVTVGAPAAAQLPGNANAGKTIFFGKGRCSTCHMMNGKGGFMASELTDYSQNRDVAAILQAILKPDASLAPDAQVVEVQTKTGERITGVVREQDALQLTLQTVDGRYHFLARSSLAAVNYTGHSLMPHDYGTRLTKQELNELVSYALLTARNASAIS